MSLASWPELGTELPTSSTIFKNKKEVLKIIYLIINNTYFNISNYSITSLFNYLILLEVLLIKNYF